MIYNIEDIITELKSLSIDTPKKNHLPDDQLLKEYEGRIGFVFSDEYKKFLKESSDVFVGELSLFIVTKDSDSHYELSNALIEARKIGLPKDWLPICEDNGDYYCLIKDGIVRFWSHNGMADESWPNLATWIKEVWIERN